MSEEYNGPEHAEALGKALKRLAHFRIGTSQVVFLDARPLGVGGHAVVKKAQILEGPSAGGPPSQPTGRIVAVKELLPGREKSMRMGLRFAREMLIWASLDHDRILPVEKFCLDMEAEIAYMISPYMPKGPLTSFLLPGKSMPVQRVLWLEDLTRGLKYLHTLRPSVVHGDLKPDNMLVKEDGSAVLCDFGVSRLVEQSMPSGLTTSRSLKGSTRWLSPELLHDASHTLASDIWAWALTALQILTGKIPFYREKTEGSLLSRILQGRAPSAEEYKGLQGPRTLPLWHLLESCWMFEPSARPTITDCWNRMDQTSLLLGMIETKHGADADAADVEAGDGKFNYGAPSNIEARPPERPVSELELPILPTSQSDPKPHRHSGGPRSQLGCVRCKRQKKKCDEMHPTCGLCKRLGHDCVWSDTHAKPNRSERGVSRPDPRDSAYSSNEAPGLWRRRSPSGTSTPAVSDSDWTSL